MANAEKLTDELKAAGLPVAGCASDGRVFWQGTPTAAQATQAASVVAAHVPALTREQNLRAAGLDASVLIAALVLRTSTDWLTLPLAVRTRAQGIIDAAASRVAARFS